MKDIGHPFSRTLYTHIVDLQELGDLENGWHVLRYKEKQREKDNSSLACRSVEKDLIKLPSYKMIRSIMIEQIQESGGFKKIQHKIFRKYWPKEVIIALLKDVGYREIRTCFKESALNNDGWLVYAKQMKSILITAKK